MWKLTEKKKIIVAILISVFVGVVGTIGVNLIINSKTTNETKNVSATSANEKETAKFEANAEKVNKKQKQANINITQINTDNFPLIKVYFSVMNEQNNIIKGLETKHFNISEKLLGDSYNVNESISDLKLMNEGESINLNLVMDVSDSMKGNKLQQAKNSANNFLNTVNYKSGDKIEIISFNDYIYINQPFSNEQNTLRNCIDSLNSEGATAFYDSLYTALSETNKQFGHKCIIAFTDGKDNRSQHSKQDIIDLSKKLSIPIYVIGVGNDVESQDLDVLSKESNGYYKSISDIKDIEDIYKDIFNKQKAQYVLTYTSKNSQVSNDWRNITIDLNSDEYNVSTNTKFIPKQAINVDNNSINVRNVYQNDIIELNNNLKEDLMTAINKYNSYWFAAMTNKNANLIVNSTQIEKNRTNSMIQDMKDKGKSYVGYMTKTIFDLDSVNLESQNGQYIAYISDSEYFNDIYYTGTSLEPLPNHKLWKYKLIYDNNSKTWLVDSHTALSEFNPVNKREF